MTKTVLDEDEKYVQEGLKKYLKHHPPPMLETSGQQEIYRDILNYLEGVFIPGLTVKNSPRDAKEKRYLAGLEPYFVRGKVYLQRGDFPGAESAFRKALAADHFEGNAYEGLGDVYSATGRPTEALRAYDKAMELNPRDLRAIEGQVHSCPKVLSTCADPAGSLRKSL